MMKVIFISMCILASSLKTLNSQARSYETCDFLNYIYWDLKVKVLNVKDFYICSEPIGDSKRFFENLSYYKNQSLDKSQIEVVNIPEKVKCSELRKYQLSLNKLMDLKYTIQLDSIGQRIENLTRSIGYGTDESAQKWRELGKSNDYKWYLNQVNYQTPKFLYFHDIIKISENQLIVFVSYNGTKHSSRELTLIAYIFERNLV